MARGQRKCIVCGSDYTYCPRCGNGNAEETWRYLYDTELCNSVFDILSSYSFKHISKDEAREKLEGLDIPKGMKFNAETKKQINAIMAKPKKETQIVNED
jgi:hypothetical protein